MNELYFALQDILTRLKELADDLKANPNVKFVRRIKILNLLMNLRSKRKAVRLSKLQLAKLQEKYRDIEYSKRMKLKDEYPELINLIEEYIFPTI